MALGSTDNIPQELAQPAKFYDIGLRVLEKMLDDADDDESDEYFDLTREELEFFYRAVRDMMEDFRLTQAVVFALAYRAATQVGVHSGQDAYELSTQALKSVLSRSDKSRSH